MAIAPLSLWIPAPDPSAAGVVTVSNTPYILVGSVGLLYQDGATIQVTGSGLGAVTGPVFLLTNELSPRQGDRLWPVGNVQSTGFSLTGTELKLTGFATASSVLPNCTGTVVKQASGSTVDGTKPCKPWSSFPQYEELILK
jgi:hypothetical protein